MIGHVAASREARGRVVLRLGCGAAASDSALEAAARIARAFDSEIEGLFVEDRQLMDLTAFPFSREIPLTGGSARPLSAMEMERELRAAFRAAQARVAALARRTGTRTYCSTLRDDPLTALVHACARSGPWNVVVIGEAFGPRDGGRLGDILAQVRDATGLVTVGPRSRRQSGPVIVAAEDPERLPAMIRTAERLAAADGKGVKVRALLIADHPDELRWMEGQARLLLAQGPFVDIVTAPAAYGEPAVVAETLRRLAPGFVIARFGGLAVPADDLRPLSAALECPLFLVR